MYNQDDCYELAELTESEDDAPLRRRAESVAVVSWRLVCSCMILVLLVTDTSHVQE